MPTETTGCLPWRVRIAFPDAAAKRRHLLAAALLLAAARTTLHKLLSKSAKRHTCL
jgi:hypothetical protein